MQRFISMWGGFSKHRFQADVYRTRIERNQELSMLNFMSKLHSELEHFYQTDHGREANKISQLTENLLFGSCGNNLACATLQPKSKTMQRCKVAC